MIDEFVNYSLDIMRSKIRTKRMLKGLTQEQLAKECNLNPTYISRIESGKRIPTLQTLIRIACGLNCQPFKLLKNRKRGGDYGQV